MPTLCITGKLAWRNVVKVSQSVPEGEGESEMQLMAKGTTGSVHLFPWAIHALNF